MVKRLINSLLKIFTRNVHSKGTCRLMDCSCGKKYEVWTNLYGSGNTGMGSCECGKCCTYVN